MLHTYVFYIRPTITVMNSFWLNYFSDCRTAENVRIVCRDGVLQSQKLFLNAVRSDLRSYMLSTVSQEYWIISVCVWCL